MQTLILVVFFAVVEFSAANYCVDFKFVSFDNDGGIIKDQRRCDPDSNCDTKLAVCVSEKNTSNCTPYQYTKTYVNTNSVDFNDDIYDESEKFEFCSEAQVPDSLYIHIQVSDMDGQAVNDSESEVIFQRMSSIAVKSLNEYWRSFSNTKSNSTIKVVFNAKIDCQPASCRSDSVGTADGHAFTAWASASTLRTTASGAAVYLATASDSESDQGSLQSGAARSEGLVVPWWFVTGCVGALVGAFIVTLAVLCRKQRQHLVSATDKVKGGVSVTRKALRNTYMHNDLSNTRRDSVTSGHSADYDQLHTVNNNFCNGTFDETRDETSIYCEPNPVYDVPQDHSLIESVVSVEVPSTNIQH